MKLFLLRYSKKAFIYLRLHKFFRLFRGISGNLLYLTKLSTWAEKNRKIAYNDFPSKWDYQKRFGLYAWVIEKQNLSSIPVNYLEFGVAGGHSFRWFLEQNKNPESNFYGFDTFTGLPEDWGSYKKGTFSSNNQVPLISDSRGKFFQGLFQQTLPGFLPRLNNRHRNIIMMDADLYSSTIFVLNSLAPFLKKDDIIFFDEFAVPKHEFRAFDEFTRSFPHKLELIAAASNYYFTAFKVG